MSTEAKETVTDEIIRKVVVATAVSVAGAFIGTILLPGIGTALGAKLGAFFSGSSTS